MSQPAKINRIFFFCNENDARLIEESVLKNTFSYISKTTVYSKKEAEVLVNVMIKQKKLLTEEEFNMFCDVITNILQKHINIFYKTSKEQKYLYNNIKPVIKNLEKPKILFIDDD